MVVHGAGSAIAAALERVEGIRVETAADPAGVPSGTPILVTFRWDDVLLTPHLRWVQSISAGTEQFPAPRLAEAGVALTSARGVHGPQVAEHALALLLALTRGVGAATLGRARRSWEWPPVVELGGLTMGILGLGVIGEAVAVRARALGMRVIGTSRSPDAYRGPADEVLSFDRVDEVFRRSDVVVVALPGGEETRHLVDAARLALLGEGWLVNVGRGSVVDEGALVEALTSGSLRGAGLDVFESEPLPESSPLWDLSNVVITPHVAGASPHYGSRLAEVFRANLAAYHGEGEWVNRVV